MNDLQSLSTAVHRRTFLRRARWAGAVALGSLLDPTAAGGDASETRLRTCGRGRFAPLHHAAKAKRVIWLTMAGGPSHLETFDYKPKLAELHGQPMPESFTKGQQIAQLQGQKLICFGPQTQVQEVRPERAGDLRTVPADRLGRRRHLHRPLDDDRRDQSRPGPHVHEHRLADRRPAVRWARGSPYGLGSEADDLPGFVVLTSLGHGGQNQPIAARQWSRGFLPSRFQGVHLRGKGDPVLYLSNPAGRHSRPAAGRRRGRSTRSTRSSTPLVDDPEIATRIAQYEMAFQMQASVPELMDTSGEPKHVLDLYGCQPGDGSFASNCLLARRLAERGVRFIQLYHHDWDHHGGVKDGRRAEGPGDRPRLRRADHRPEAARHARGHADRLGRRVRPHADVARGQRPRPSQQRLLDLARRRRHQAAASATARPTNSATPPSRTSSTVHDLHATMLHLLGIDHNRFTFKFQGLDAKLTGVEGANVLKKILV